MPGWLKALARGALHGVIDSLVMWLVIAVFVLAAVAIVYWDRLT